MSPVAAITRSFLKVTVVSPVITNINRRKFILKLCCQNLYTRNGLTTSPHLVSNQVKNI